MKSILAISCIATLTLAGCKSPRSRPDPAATVALRQYGCVSCHTIPGVAGANATVGPPLDRLGSRTYIAGTLVNTPSNLSFWIQHPQTVHPGTAMPEMHITAQDADTISRYLETLH